MLKSLLNKLPYIKKLQQQNADLVKDNANFYKNCAFPPGHFYSVLVSVDYIKKNERKIWNENVPGEIPGIELQTQNQINLVQSFRRYYSEQPFADEKQKHLRYYFINDYYCHTDSLMLYSMIRRFNPKKIIEIGSGFSSAIMLDTNEIFSANQINLTFIEPYPERLYSLLQKKDKENTTIIESDLQSVPLEKFQALKAGDILFVDSTHVVKTGSDVNYIFFEILPALNSGVLLHFHDVFYPFEYPKKWVLEGRNWNEDYFLRAFLMYNHQFEIKIFNDYLHQFHKDVFAHMPLCYRNHGSSLWLQKK
jgi:predicted O-methyltransferase YrrM